MAVGEYVAPGGTKLALIEAAGELFAEVGVKAAGIRAIAEKAGANIGSIHYHFGGKENLYRAAIEYVLHRRVTEQNVQIPVPASATAAQVSDLLRLMARKRLAAVWPGRAVRWHARLLMRLFAEGPEDAWAWIDGRILQPDFSLFSRIVALARPDYPQREVRKLFFVFIGQVIFYAQHGEQVLRTFAANGRSRSLLNELADYISLSLTRTLGLPDAGDRRRIEE